MDSDEREMNPVALTIINPRKEYWPSRRFERETSLYLVFTLRGVLRGLGIWKTNVNVLRNIKPLPDDKMLDRSKLKQIADDILKCI